MITSWGFRYALHSVNMMLLGSSLTLIFATGAGGESTAVNTALIVLSGLGILLCFSRPLKGGVS